MLRLSQASAPPLDALLHALFADADTGVLILDPDARVVSINPAALRMLAVTAARAEGMAAADLVRPVVAGDDLVGEACRTAKTEREVVIATAKDAELPVLLRSFRVGQPPWVILILRDLSQARRMQQEMRRQERLATLGQLSAGVAHEIRNPLAGIGTSAQVLLRRFEPRDDRARFVRAILDEVSRLDRIVTSLLQYARPRVPELKPSALGSCIERVLELSTESLRQAGIHVELEVAPRLAPVYIDADLVTQVLLNVTLNAIQAMPSGGTLRYEIRKVQRRRPPRGPGRRAGDRATRGARGEAPWMQFQQVRVTDTGSGMPRSVLSKLFDPFFSTKPDGTGLGLAISQSIMQEHGGAIEIASREGHGTTVILSFPLEKRHGERRHPDPHAGRSNAARR